jgi:hypothetical protein
VTDADPIGWCPVHEKLLFRTRREARIFGRRFPAARKNAYRCEDQQHLWHLGELAGAIRRGVMTRDEFYNG